MTTKTWLILGFIGQSCFSLRFLIQWITSEIKKKSVIPEAFWYLSVAGGLLCLGYSIYRKDPVFIFGMATGLVVYTRNLVLVLREKANAALPLAELTE